MENVYNLERFVSAQDAVYDDVVEELRAGRKESHWMWFIFPQIQGLGSSSTAVLYAIRSADEARAYLDHRLLGARLFECSELVLKFRNANADKIFGYPDNLKFHSSMTLFAAVAKPERNPAEGVFDRALQSYFAGQNDSATLARLK